LQSLQSTTRPWDIVRQATTAELQELEATLDPELVEALVPTRSAALLRALHVIGPDPRTTLHRLHELIRSLEKQLTERLNSDSQRPFREMAAMAAAAASHIVPPVSATVGVIATISESSDGGVDSDSSQTQKPHSETQPASNYSAADTTAAPPPRNTFRDSELERIHRSQYKEQTEIEKGPGASPDAHTPALHGFPGPSIRRSTSTGSGSVGHAAMDALSRRDRLNSADLCCGGETLWLMRERWHKLQKDFYSLKKDRFDLSKIPDIYDQVKHDCLHNASLGLQNLVELHTLVSMRVQ
jgi:hypothetical protein